MSPKKEPYVALVAFLDLIGVLVLFNAGHWWVNGTFASDYLLSWKLILVAALSFLCNYLMDTYSFESQLSRLGLIERSVIALGLTGTAVAVLVYAIGPSFIGGFVGRGVLAVSLFSLWTWSLAFRYLLARVLTQEESDRWLIVDASDNSPRASFDLATHFRRRENDRPLVLLTDGSTNFLDPRIQHAGGLANFDKVVQDGIYKGIIVIGTLGESLVTKLLSTRLRGTRIYSLNDFYESTLGRLPIAQLSEDWIATAQGFDLIHNPIGLRFKRYVDLLVALVALGALMPLMLLVALIVLLTTGRPVLFVQERTGEKGRTFSMLKFRTMRRDAEAAGPQFAARDDPRATPMGRILRKFCLDELPQFWNVLTGEMSLIGPRPERPVFVSELERQVPYYNLRHLVKPGITGWAQVMHGYGDSTEDAAEKLQYDLFYIKNYSLLLDIGIMIRSVRVVLFGTGR